MHVHLLQKSIALPDVHSGYGFAIGNVAAFDMADPEAVVSPGGVGFDINCGVRLLRTNMVLPSTCHALRRMPCQLSQNDTHSRPYILSVFFSLRELRCLR